MGGGQIAAVNIEWIQADGVTLSAILPFVSNGATTALTPQGQWNYQTIRGEAPDDAAFARFLLITGDFAPGGAGGAPHRRVCLPFGGPGAPEASARCGAVVGVRLGA